MRLGQWVDVGVGVRARGGHTGGKAERAAAIETRLTIGTDTTRLGEGVSLALSTAEPGVQHRVGLGVLENSENSGESRGSCDSFESGGSRERRRMIGPDDLSELIPGDPYPQEENGSVKERQIWINKERQIWGDPRFGSVSGGRATHGCVPVCHTG